MFDTASASNGVKLALLEGHRSIAQAMGKAIGGGTSINGMVWARGHKNDFDHWAKEAGDDAWNYRHVLDIYRRIEDWHGVPDPQRRGSGGEVFVQPAPNPSSIAPAFLRAAESLGIPTFADQNGVMQEGSGGAAITNVRIRDGRRLNIPSSYLYPVMDQANLTVLTGAYVNRLTIEGNAVTGVEFEWQNEVRRIKASSEVVLSAGATQTPKTLMLSGIGDRAELDRFGIATCRTCRASAGTSRIIRSSVADCGKPLGRCPRATTPQRPTSS